MINKEILNEEQLQKLNNIEQKGYLDRIPSDDERAIQYIDNWRILQNNDNDQVESKELIEEQSKPRKELTIEQRLVKKQKELAKIKEKESKILAEIDELTLKKIDDFKTHLSEEDYKAFMEFKASQQPK